MKNQTLISTPAHSELLAFRSLVDWGVVALDITPDSIICPTCGAVLHSQDRESIIEETAQHTRLGTDRPCLGGLQIGLREALPVLLDGLLSIGRLYMDKDERSQARFLKALASLVSIAQGQLKLSAQALSFEEGVLLYDITDEERDHSEIMVSFFSDRLKIAETYLRGDLPPHPLWGLDHHPRISIDGIKTEVSKHFRLKKKFFHPRRFGNWMNLGTISFGVVNRETGGSVRVYLERVQNRKGFLSTFVRSDDPHQTVLGLLYRDGKFKPKNVKGLETETASLIWFFKKLNEGSFPESVSACHVRSVSI